MGERKGELSAITTGTACGTYPGARQAWGPLTSRRVPQRGCPCTQQPPRVPIGLYMDGIQPSRPLQAIHGSPATRCLPTPIPPLLPLAAPSLLLGLRPSPAPPHTDLPSPLLGHQPDPLNHNCIPHPRCLLPAAPST